MSGGLRSGAAAVLLCAAAAVFAVLALGPSVARAELESPAAVAAGDGILPGGAHFSEPLMAMEPGGLIDERLLERALARYERRAEADDFSALTRYLAHHPHSPWAVALQVNLGLEYKHYGYLSQALEAWERAWREGRAATGQYRKALVDRGVGELVLLHAQLGHRERVKELLAEIGDRPVANPGGEWVQKARENLWVMENEPKHVFLCGPLALKFLMIEEGTSPEKVRFINLYRAGPKGVSLAELARLAEKAKVELAPVFREPGQPVPTHAIVHWKTGHFSAILRPEKGGYIVKDPVLGQNPHWVSAAAIDSEATGYFLAPPGAVENAGWRRVETAEGGEVWGAGPVNGPDPNNGGPGAGGGGGGGDGGSGCGMCKYDIAELAIAVTMSDQPMPYEPPFGPSSAIRIGYNQREASQPAVFGYFNISPNWTMNWTRFIQDDPANAGQSVMRYFPNGNSWNYSGFNASTGAFAPEESDASVLVMTSTNPIAYQRQLRSGGVETYSQSDGATGYPRNVFLTSITDPQGNTLRLNYTTSGGHVLLSSLTDATGRNTTFTYGSTVSNLLITKITDPFGRSATLAYDASGRLSSITDVIGITSSFTYDASSLVSALTTPYGTTQFAYGGTGNTRFVQVTDPLGLSEREESLQPAPVASSDSLAPPSMNVLNAYLNYRDSFHWDKHQYGVAGCTPSGGCNYNAGRNTHFYHDAQNINIEWYQVEAVKQPLETRVWYNYPGQNQNLNNGTYDQPSAVGRIVDGSASQVLQRTYNASGNPTQLIDPVGRTTNLAYAANLVDLTQVQQVVNSTPQTIATYSYDSQHRPVTYTDAAGQVTQYAYNAAGELTKATLPGGLVWSLSYDALGRLTGIVNPKGATQASYAYDGLDRIATATDSEGYVLAYAYDALNRITKITYPDGTTRQYAYDKLDLASVTDREGRTTSYKYDADRRLISTTDALGAVTRYDYWENGKLKSITDPKGNVTSWTIDVEGRPATKRYADGSTTVYNYDDGGRLKAVRDALGQIKQYSYTVDNRFSTIGYSYAVNPTPGVSFSYDPYFPRLSSMIDGNGTTSWSYVAPGTNGALALQGESGPMGAVTYSYDALGRVTGRSVAGAAESFQYDELNRLIAHIDPLGQFALGYLGQTGQIASRAQTAGGVYPAQTNWSYLDNLGDRRLASIVNAGMRRFDYATTTEGLITGGTENSFRHWGYGYDADNRLTSANYSNGLNYHMTLDPDGNVAGFRNAARTRSFVYNSLNELTQETVGANVENFAYDADGELVSDGQRSYAYDAENRLIGIGYAGSSATTSFSYDGLGRRISITETTAGRTLVNLYQWCGARICRRSTPTGSTLRLYYDEGEALLSSGQNIYYGPDEIGSTRNYAVVSANGAAVKAVDFDPFGNALTSLPLQLPSSPTPDFLFAGMFRHGESSLYLTQFRAYDPQTARWTSRDPLGELPDVGATAIATISNLSFPSELANRPTPTALVAFNSAKGAGAPGRLSSKWEDATIRNLYSYGFSSPVSAIDPSGLVTLKGGVTNNNYIDPNGNVQPLSDSGFGPYTGGDGFAGSRPRDPNNSGEQGACFNYAPPWGDNKSSVDLNGHFHFYRPEGTDLNGNQIYSWVNGDQTPGQIHLGDGEGSGPNVIYSTEGYMRNMGMIK